MVQYGFDEVADAKMAFDAIREEHDNWSEALLRSGVAPLAAAAVGDGLAEMCLDEALDSYLIDSDAAEDAWRDDMRAMFWEGLGVALNLIRQAELPAVVTDPIEG